MPVTFLGDWLWQDDIHNSNVRRAPANRSERREAARMKKGKPSKGTKKDRRLKRNRRRK